MIAVGLSVTRDAGGQAGVKKRSKMTLDRVRRMTIMIPSGQG
jgi:hypothetical protein